MEAVWTHHGVAANVDTHGTHKCGHTGEPTEWAQITPSMWTQNRIDCKTKGN